MSETAAADLESTKQRLRDALEVLERLAPALRFLHTSVMEYDAWPHPTPVHYRVTGVVEAGRAVLKAARSVMP